MLKKQNAQMERQKGYPPIPIKPAPKNQHDDEFPSIDMYTISKDEREVKNQAPSMDPKSPGTYPTY